MLSEKVESNLDSIPSALREAGAVLACLFGSAARGLERPDSVLDFAVLLGEGIPRERRGELRLRLITESVGLTHTNDVDLVLLDEAPPLLAYQVITTGHLILGDRGVQVRFEVEATRRYIDTSPLRRRLGEGLLRRIRDGARSLEESPGRWWTGRSSSTTSGSTWPASGLDRRGSPLSGTGGPAGGADDRGGGTAPQRGPSGRNQTTNT